MTVRGTVRENLARVFAACIEFIGKVSEKPLGGGEPSAFSQWGLWLTAES
jgi:hypothetical protein